MGLTQVCLQLYQNENVIDGDVYMTRGRSELYVYTFLQMWALCRREFTYSMLRVSLKSCAGMVAFYNIYYDLMKTVYNSP